jgi:hypothetical protein
MNNTGGGDISVSPPETLVKFDAPLFAGIEPKGNDKNGKSQNQDGNSKIEDMLNSMIPPR